MLVKFNCARSWTQHMIAVTHLYEGRLKADAIIFKENQNFLNSFEFVI